MSLRKKNLLYTLPLLLLLVVLAWFSESRSEEGTAHALRFSQAPGFYDETFQLELLSDYDCRIYYTLDGSEPTANSIPYDGPISISDASQNENQYACIENVSTGFLVEDIQRVSQQHPDFIQEVPNYVIPGYQVDKCTVVRAAAFQGDTCIASAVGSFFVGFQEKSAYETVKVVSLVTDPENLFDHETGIYVTGKEFDAVSGVLGEETSPLWRWWNANYHLRGKDSEREAHVEVFGEDRSTLLSSPCGIRIQGAGSRGLLPKSLSVYARKEYGGSEVFDSPLFEEGIQPHKFVLFAGGDDNVFKLKDPMVSTLESGLNFCTMDYTPCVVFLDGEFWGTYYIAESYNRKYIQDHYGVPEEDVIIVKEGEVTEGLAGDADHFFAMRDFISENDMTLSDNYRHAQTLMDLDSFIDYYASLIYLARHDDWPAYNVAAWRSRSQGTGYRDGRWRWMLYDVNSPGLEPELAELDSLALAISQDPVLKSLCQNRDFKTRFAQRLRSLSQEVFTDEACSRFLNDYLAVMTEPLCLSARRFYGTDRRQEIIANAEGIRAFFRQRPAYVDTMINENFGAEFTKDLP